MVDRTDDEPAATGCDATTPADCSLRGAILAANALAASPAPEASDITLPEGTYALTQESSCTYRQSVEGFERTSTQLPLCINANVTLHGAGADLTVIDAGDLDGALFVSADAAVVIRDLTIENGNVTQVRFGGGPQGGGINNQGTLTLVDVVVTRNRSALVGGGIFNAQQLTIEGGSLEFNDAVGTGGPVVASGGAIYASTGSATTIVDATIAGSTADHSGGGIYLVSGSLTVIGSTLSGNTATVNTGGAIEAFGTTTLVVANSTLTGNRALQGGAIHQTSGGQATLASTTIAGNTAGNGLTGAGGGIATEGALTLKNTIVAGNALDGSSAIGPDCWTFFTSITSAGHNLIQSDAACTIAGDTTGNVLGQAPQLAPLADNGGPTRTRALLGGSPAVDAGDPAGCTDAAGGLLAVDQRGSPRSVDGNADGTARCDIGAFELGGGGSGGGPAITRVQPAQGGDAGPLLVIVYGSGFQGGATARLQRAGQPDVVGTQTTVGGGGQLLLASFDLAGRTLGAWDVVVENPDATTGSAAGAFTIAPAREPELWVDFVGPQAARAGRPVRYRLLYGNRGNVDAFGVPLLLGVATGTSVAPQFAIEPPPQRFGDIVILEFGRFYERLVVGEGPPLEQLPLLLPVVPAGFTGALEVLLTPDARSIGDVFPVRVEIAEPLFDGEPKPEAVAKLVEGARAKSERLFGFVLPPSVDPALADYLEDELRVIEDEGVSSLLGSFGSETAIYSLSQLAYDLAAFGLVWAQNHSPLAARRPLPGPDPLLALVTRAASAVGDLCVAPAWAGTLSCVCGQGPRGKICCEGCSCPRDDGKDVPEIPPACRLQDIGKPGCKLPENPGECAELGFLVQSGNDVNGKPVSICTNDRRCIFSNPLGTSCIKIPIQSVRSMDPNDKSGPPGSGDAAHFVPGGALEYVIRFENKPEASAPAAEVTIDDTLDASVLDLETLTLGPIGFGSETRVVPPPGSSAFSADVDLRPANDLIVRVEASLEPASALLRWHFTSLDPATMEPPEDPFAGFLPPNQSPPEGDGYVSFRVEPKTGLASGTEIANQASIVFDVNDPIETPVWLNTIDVTPPESEMGAVAPSAECSQDLRVSWSGSDLHAGIAGYEVAVSEDGGPYARWLPTDATDGTFTGRWAHGYAFRTTAWDRAGNPQEGASVPSDAVPVPDCGPYDLAVTKLRGPKRVRLRDREPARTGRVKVQVQNRSGVAQKIADADALAGLVTLAVDPLAPGCPAPKVELYAGKKQKALPFTLRPKKKLNVLFDVTFDCAVEPAGGRGLEDFALRAAAHQSVLGAVDSHVEDDECPRPRPQPPTKDPFPDGRIAERGCSAALVDVSVR